LVLSVFFPCFAAMQPVASTTAQFFFFCITLTLNLGYCFAATKSGCCFAAAG